MKLLYRQVLVIVMILISPIFSWGQSNPVNTTIKGSIVDIESNEPLPGVNITVKGTLFGTVSDSKGNFQITPRQLPVTLAFSLTGFRTQEVEVSETSIEELPIQLTAGSLLGNEVVISASRLEVVNCTPFTFSKAS